MIANRALERIHDGRPAFGFTVVLGSPVIAEQLAAADFDWVWIDTQHGYWSQEGLISALQAIGMKGPTPIVRVGSNDFCRIGQVLDAGALGVIVPLVNTAGEAREAVKAVYYPPKGDRSRGGARLGLLGDEYFEHAGENILLAVMIETVEALGNVDRIAAVEGIDCVFMGPGDLSASMETEYGSDRHEEAIARVLEAAQSAGVPAGFPCGSPEEAVRRADQGFDLVTCYSDNACIGAGVEKVEDALEDFGRR